jgi:hypothetical protein
MSSSSEEASLTRSSEVRALSPVEPAPAAIPDRAAPTTSVDPVSLPAVACPDPLALPLATRGVATEAVKRARRSSEDERRRVPSLQEQPLLPQGEEDPHRRKKNVPVLKTNPPSVCASHAHFLSRS